VTGESVERRPEVIPKFVRGMRKGADWLNANNGQDSFFELVAGYTRRDPARIKAMRRLADLMVEHGMLKQPVDPAAMVFVTP
jgi:ABC-type nitrate/sulfonate/bicarbonate transport system substrate-binding protein